MQLEATTEADLGQIKDWWKADEDHKHKPFSDDFFLTGSGLLTFRLDDEDGPLLYCRLDEQNEFGLSRIHLQFAPEDIVSKRRLVVAMLKAMTVVFDHVKSTGAAGIVFESTSATLISFFERQGFVRVAETDDYVLAFDSPTQTKLVN
jgi:hypothetical protein